MRITLVLLAAGVALAGPVLAQPAAPAPQPNVFTTLGAAPADRPETVAGQRIAIDIAALQALRPGQPLTLPAAGLLGRRLVVERMDQPRPDVSVLRAHLPGHPQASAVLVRHGDAVVGVIRDPAEGWLLRLRPAPAGGGFLLEEIDLAAYPPEACFTPGAANAGAPPAAPPSADETAGGSPEAPCNAGGPVFDVLVAYSNPARAAAGGDAAIIAQAQLAVEVANDAYTNSGVAARMRLVHVMHADYDEPGTQEDWLDWVSFSFDAEAQAVRAARDTYAADFVCMLTGGGSGFGWCTVIQNRAFSVSNWTRAVDTWTLAHEIGHNQGCTHNREDAGSCGINGHAYGYYFHGDSGTEWGTVMSYQGQRIAHFSNPNRLYDGQPTGVPIGDPGEAHNADVINDTTIATQNYRLTRYDVWLDFDYVSVNYLGTYASPYRMLAVAVDEVRSSPHAGELPVLHVKAGASAETALISKPMRIEGCDGVVRIGG